MHPPNLSELIKETAGWLRSRGIGKIDFGLILGSGLGDVVKQFEILDLIPYREIPHLAGTSVMSHRGTLCHVRAGDQRGIVFQGRIHYYEGFEMWQVAYPVRILKAMGARLLITTGAAGGLNPEYEVGQIVILNDHISLMPSNPLRGAHSSELGSQFPDMSEPYSIELSAKIEKAAGQEGGKVSRGVYAGLPGPNLETRAEYAYLHKIGADLVGMSIIPEVITGVQAELKIAGVCVVSNQCYPPASVGKTTLEHVVQTVTEQAGLMGKLIYSSLIAS